MPRTRKTQTGVPAQSGPPVAGQTYGAGAQQQQLDQAMPKPNMQKATAPSAPAGPAASPDPNVQPPSANPGPYDMAAALQAARQLSSQTGLLTAPTARPNEPITQGLNRGPGAGPEVLGLPQGSPTGDLFRRMSQELGDPFYAELANRARA